MPLKLLGASIITLGMLLGSVTAILFTVAAIGGAPPSVLVLMMGLTVLMSLLGWGVGPWWTDLIQGWLYSVEKLSFAEFEQAHPGVGAFLRRTCEQQGLPLPMMRLIRDDNPTAYTYGSLPGNSRIALSYGLFRFLDEEEVCAVAAHELGHIRHYDFAVMTLASTLLQLLYEMYWIFTRSGRVRSRRGNNPLPAIGLVAYVLWWVGTYVVLYLSRTREYMADAFAAKVMGDAAPLQRALVKIAYGMAEVARTNDKANTRLLNATRALGIADPKAAAGLGNAYRTMAIEDSPAAPQAGVVHTSSQPMGQRSGGGGGFDARKVEPVFLFDLFNPWATVSELSSTHPLTGKRIRSLNEQSKELGQEPLFRFDEVDRAGQQLDKARLWGSFGLEVVIYFAPFLLPLLSFGAAFFIPQLGGTFLLMVGLGMVIKGGYRYSVGQNFQPTTMYELMCDPYTSPMRGRPVQLEGEIIGKAMAGSKVGEDLTMKDRSGGLVMLNYESPFSFIGNMFFGFGKARRSIGKRVTARGWFRRSIFQFVDLADMTIEGEKINSWTRFWGIAGGVLVSLVGLVVAAGTFLGGANLPR